MEGNTLFKRGPLTSNSYMVRFINSATLASLFYSLSVDLIPKSVGSEGHFTFSHLQNWDVFVGNKIMRIHLMITNTFSLTVLDWLWPPLNLSILNKVGN